MTVARYDGIAEWYDSFTGEAAESHGAELLRLLGRGDGTCLDLGCGTGHYLEAIRASGRTPVGLDRSADQLRMARDRSGALVQGGLIQGDAAALPFADAAFATVVARWVSTDVDDFGARIIHPTYRAAGWHPAAPWWRPGGIRERVGMRHVPLAELLTAFPAAGLSIERVVEPREEPIPYALAVRAYRPAA